MTNPATFTADDRSLELPFVEASQGNNGYDIGKLLAKTGDTTFDIGFANTAVCKSAITYIDGDAGVLNTAAGYPIEQLAEKFDVSRDLLPGPLRRTAHRGRAAGLHREDQPSHGDRRAVARAVPHLPASIAPDAGPVGSHHGAVDVLDRHHRLRARAGGRRHPAPHGEGADAGGVLVPELHRHADPVARLLAQLHRELPAHVRSGGSRSRTSSTTPSLEPSTFSSSSMPTTSRTARPRPSASSGRRRPTCTRR